MANDTPQKGSYENINYSLRPAKAVERRMLCDTFQRLSPFGDVASYRYIGFGSTYFSDFVLFHRALGIRNMTSIERDEHNEVRFNKNKPFDCVKMKFGHSNIVLPTLKWDVRTILWLDCDGHLDDTVLTDVHYFCAQASPGSMLVVTVNAHPFSINADVPTKDWAAKRLETLRSHISMLPNDVEARDLRKWGTAKLYRDVIHNKVNEILNARNGNGSSGNSISYKQILNFAYQDGAQMLTVGGVLYDEGQAAALAASRLEHLSFARAGDEMFHIEIPNLTYRELHALDEIMPTTKSQEAGFDGIPSGDIEKYAKIYRYFPKFVQTDG